MPKDLAINTQNQITKIANRLINEKDYQKVDAYHDLYKLTNHLSKYTHQPNHISRKLIHITLAVPMDVGDIAQTVNDSGRWVNIKIIKVDGINAIGKYVK